AHRGHRSLVEAGELIEIAREQGQEANLCLEQRRVVVRLWACRFEDPQRQQVGRLALQEWLQLALGRAQVQPPEGAGRQYQTIGVGFRSWQCIDQARAHFAQTFEVEATLERLLLSQERVRFARPLLADGLPPEEGGARLAPLCVDLCELTVGMPPVERRFGARGDVQLAAAARLVVLGHLREMQEDLAQGAWRVSADQRPERATRLARGRIEAGASR